MLTHKFVEHIPDELKEGVVYACLQFATVAHKCCCGCGNEVITPLSPTDWKLLFDGRTITLYPSVGNWSFKCQSHYWIKGNRVMWAPKWSRKMIEEGRKRDRIAKRRYYDPTDVLADHAVAKCAQSVGTHEEPSAWQRLKNWWRGV